MRAEGALPCRGKTEASVGERRAPRRGRSAAVPRPGAAWRRLTTGCAGAIFHHPSSHRPFLPHPGAGNPPSPCAAAGRRLAQWRTRPRLPPRTLPAARGVFLPPLLGDRRAPGGAGGSGCPAAAPGGRVPPGGAHAPAADGGADPGRRAPRRAPRAAARTRGHAPALADGVARLRLVSRAHRGRPSAAAAAGRRAPLPRRTSAAFQPGSSSRVTPGPLHGPARNAAHRSGRRSAGARTATTACRPVPRRPDP